MNDKIGSYLDFLFENPISSLNYSKDYELLIAVVLSAQCTDKRVNLVTKELFTKYSTIEALNQASIDDIKKIIYPVGTYNKKSEYIKKITNILIIKYNKKVPNDLNTLQTLPGVGRKTANVVGSVLYNIPTIAVDTHVTRVSKRLGLVKKDDNVLTIENKLMTLIDKSLWSKRHHQLVLFGRLYCKARNPLCNICHLKDICLFSKRIK